jgi:hypothetical protein
LTAPFAAITTSVLDPTFWSGLRAGAALTTKCLQIPTRFVDSAS